MCFLIYFAAALFYLRVSALPIVDPGLFVISGVKTCGNGKGYCLLGSDCSLDQDFMEDNTGHCSGLKSAFTPSTHFVCCSDSKKENEIEDIKKPNASKFPPAIEADLTTTEDIQETTTFEVDRDYMFLEPDKEVNNCEECNSTVKFSMNGNQLCLGSHVGNGWVATSANCAMKVFRIGMVNVVGSFVDDLTFGSSVKTIAVNENYRPTASNILLPETNNLGLIQLNDTMIDKCAPCIPKTGQSFAGQICKSFSNTTEPFCESELETMQGEAKEEFLTLSCDTAMQSGRSETDSDSGKPLICDGYLSGIETSAGVGMTVFTQLSLYSKWLSSNMEPKPTQLFRTTTTT